MAGKRRLIKSKDIKHLHVPMFDGLSTRDMLDWAKQYEEVQQALPYIVGEIDMLHRQYVINVIYTLVGENFQLWVEKTIRVRNKKLAEEKNLNISMDPEIAKIFKNSTTVSGKCIFVGVLFLVLFSLERNQ